MTIDRLSAKLLAPARPMPHMANFGYWLYNRLVYSPVPRFWNFVTLHEHFANSQGWMCDAKNHTTVRSPYIPCD